MQNSWIWAVASWLWLVLFIPACERTDLKEAEQHYETRGVLRGVSPDQSTFDIQHEDIPNFMPSMTMSFLSKQKVPGLRVGDALAFRMTVTRTDFWIDRVRKIERREVSVVDPKPVTVQAQPSPRLREGDDMPFFNLTDQERKHINLETFRGRPLIVTFIFTRCPVPNFCPRMSSNFAELQTAIKSGDAALGKAHLLSVTLDPDFDNPDILQQYAAYHKADPQTWTFATGQTEEIEALTRAFAVYTQKEGGTISHGLATALVGNDGKIVKIWRGNGWSPAEVISEIRAQKL